MKTLLVQKYGWLLAMSLTALFFIGSGIMNVTLTVADADANMGDPGMWFIKAVIETGYLIQYIGIFKIITGGLILWPRYRALGMLMGAVFLFNIAVWALFMAPSALLLAVPFLAVCLVWMATHWWHYENILKADIGPASTLQ